MSKEGRDGTRGGGVAGGTFIATEDVCHFFGLQVELAEKLSQCSATGECLEHLLDAAMRVPGIDCGWIHTTDTGREICEITAARGMDVTLASRISSCQAGSGEEAREAGICPPVVLPLLDEGGLTTRLVAASRGGAGVPPCIISVLECMTALAQGALKLILLCEQLERRVSERTTMLHQSESRFRQLAEATFEGIAVTESGILLDGNPRMAEMHGYSLEEMIGRPVYEFIAPGSREVVRRHINEGLEASYEYEGLHQNGTTFHAEVRASMRDWQGRRIRVTAIRDITAIKEAAARLRSLQTELRHAQRLGLVSEVSAGILHQIGQPLCAMGMNLSAALSRLRAPEPAITEAMPMLEDIERDLAMVRKTISRLRALADPGKPSRVRMDMNQMVNDVLGLVAEEARRRQLRIETFLDPEMAAVHGDPVQLSQVLLILVNNAFDACDGLPPERKSVVVRTGTLADGAWARVTISDNGCGIRPDVMNDLFAPFLTTKQDGLGMGLRLSRTIVHSHGGHISGTNRTDACGAEFSFSLPVAIDDSYP